MTVKFEKEYFFSKKSYFWYLLGQSHFKKSVSTYDILARFLALVTTMVTKVDHGN